MEKQSRKQLRKKPENAELFVLQVVMVREMERVKSKRTRKEGGEREKKQKVELWVFVLHSPVGILVFHNPTLYCTQFFLSGRDLYNLILQWKTFYIIPNTPFMN